jgi:RNase P protein component
MASRIAPGFDFLVIARIACLVVEPDSLDKTFEQVFTRAGILSVNG